MHKSAWDGNKAIFSQSNASIANGVLTMSLTKVVSGAVEPHPGVDALSTTTPAYGRVSASMRCAKGSIKHLGNSSRTSQLNAMVYTGTYIANGATSVTPTQEPQLANLDFNADKALYQYEMERTPSSVKYHSDGVLLRTWTTNISLLRRPMNLLFTIWASNASSGPGAIDTTAIPTTAELDWVRAYNYAS